MFTWLPCLPSFGIPTLIPVIRLPRRSREEAGATRGSLKRKSLSHSTPGKFERSSRNCFPKRAISNPPALERLTGDRRCMEYTTAGALTQTRRRVLGQPSWGSISRTGPGASAVLRRVLELQQQFEPAVLLVSKRCKTAPIQCQDLIGP